LAVIQQCGQRVAVIADLNSDDVPELVFSGAGLEPAFASGVFVADGALIAQAKGNAAIVNLSSDSNDSRVIQATVEEVTVDSLATVGDLDADGLADIAMGHTGNAGVSRVATVIYGSALSANFGTANDIDLTNVTATDGAAFSDIGSAAAQTVDVDPVAVTWVGDADGAAGDELMIAVPNAEPLSRKEAGHLLVFSNANVAAAGTPQVTIDSTDPLAALVRALPG